MVQIRRNTGKTPIQLTHSLETLESWVLANCNGDWETDNGIAIFNTQMPGWDVHIIETSKIPMEAESVPWGKPLSDGTELAVFPGRFCISSSILLTALSFAVRELQRRKLIRKADEPILVEIPERNSMDHLSIPVPPKYSIDAHLAIIEDWVSRNNDGIWEEQNGISIQTSAADMWTVDIRDRQRIPPPANPVPDVRRDPENKTQIRQYDDGDIRITGNTLAGTLATSVQELRNWDLA